MYIDALIFLTTFYSSLKKTFNFICLELKDLILTMLYWSVILKCHRRFHASVRSIKKKR